jgi:predicted ribosome quality control (RQC) complex YloA/Tae2 family protein
MDLLASLAVARELEAALAGAVLSRVVQTAPETLVLEWWGGAQRGEERLHRQRLTPGRTRRLVLSADPEAPRVHLTVRAASALRELPPSPGGPPRFAAYLRAHAEGARLAGVSCRPADRVLTLALARRDGERLALVVELLGSHAEILVLAPDGRIVTTLRQTGSARAGGRLSPGQAYAPPGGPPKAPLAEAGAVAARLAAEGALDTGRLAREVAGIGAAIRAHLEAAGADDPARLVAAAADLAARVAEGRFEPRVYQPEEGPPVAAMLPLAHLEPGAGSPPRAAVTSYGSPSEAVEAAFGSEADRLARRAAPLRARLEKSRERLVRRLAALDGDRAGLERALAARRVADLMAAQRHVLAKGRSEVSLVDYFDPEQRTVTATLDPALDPQRNIEAYYARARKAERGIETVATRREATAAELAWVEEALQALETADAAGDLDAIEAEVAEQLGEARRTAAPTRRARRGSRTGSATPPVRRFRSTDGMEIVAGKTSVANDYVSTRLARPDDIWLHAEGYPGAHVLVRRAGRAEVPERTVLEAAAVAAVYSKARDATRVPVHVAPASAVRKPRGARPGLVTLAGPHRTVLVAPDAALVARLEVRGGSPTLP